jgi:hypothetical protein
MDLWQPQSAQLLGALVGHPGHFAGEVKLNNRERQGSPGGLKARRLRR